MLSLLLLASCSSLTARASAPTTDVGGTDRLAKFILRYVPGTPVAMAEIDVFLDPIWAVGEGGYTFQIWTHDGDPDTFRIKIWRDEGGDEVVYLGSHACPIVTARWGGCPPAPRFSATPQHTLDALIAIVAFRCCC